MNSQMKLLYYTTSSNPLPESTGMVWPVSLPWLATTECWKSTSVKFYGLKKKKRHPIKCGFVVSSRTNKKHEGEICVTLRQYSPGQPRILKIKARQFDLGTKFFGLNFRRLNSNFWRNSFYYGIRFPVWLYLISWVFFSTLKSEVRPNL